MHMSCNGHFLARAAPARCVWIINMRMEFRSHQSLGALRFFFSLRISCNSCIKRRVQDTNRRLCRSLRVRR